MNNKEMEEIIDKNMCCIDNVGLSTMKIRIFIQHITKYKNRK